MRNLILTFLLIVGALPGFAAPESLGHEGNGGDAVQAFFIQTGARLLTKLSRTSEGQRYLQQLPTRLSDLDATLDYRRVSSVSGILLDVTGASVDAVVEHGNIKLKKAAWLEYMSSAINIDYLVFHEMLRAAGVKDDNYIYSSSVGLFSDLYDPREATNLVNYLSPGDIKFTVLEGDVGLAVPAMIRVNNLDMKIEISSANLSQEPKILAHQDQDIVLNIPIHNSGVAKIIVYRIDYEYEGSLQAGAKFDSHREVRFQSSSPFIMNDEEKSGEDQFMNVDLLNIQSSYTESLQINIHNHLGAKFRDRQSYLNLHKVVVHFNLLRL